MSLKEQLFADLKTAMKEKDTVRKDTVQLIRSGILQIEKDKKIELDRQTEQRNRNFIGLPSRAVK